MIDEKKRRWVSVLVTVVSHLLILMIPLQLSQNTRSHEKKEFNVAVNFVIKEIQPIVPVEIKKGVTARKMKTQKIKPVARKKGPMPGDRSRPVVARSGAIPYPKIAINNAWKGTVKVKVTIDSRGNITMIKVVKSSGYESLDQIFISSIKKNYQFKPKRVRGKNKAGTILLSHRFK